MMRKSFFKNYIGNLIDTNYALNKQKSKNYVHKIANTEKNMYKVKIKKSCGLHQQYSDVYA